MVWVDFSPFSCYYLIRYLEGWAGRLACGEMHGMLYQNLSVIHLYLGLYQNLYENLELQTTILCNLAIAFLLHV